MFNRKATPESEAAAGGGAHKIVAVTACPTGIAHTYMAAEKLEQAARKLRLDLKVETQGAMGIENELLPAEIAAADLVLVVADIVIEGEERFFGKTVRRRSLQSVLKDAETVLSQLAS